MANTNLHPPEQMGNVTLPTGTWRWAGPPPQFALLALPRFYAKRRRKGAKFARGQALGMGAVIFIWGGVI